MRTHHKEQQQAKDTKTENGQSRHDPQLPDAAQVLRLARNEALGTLAPNTF